MLINDALAMEALGARFSTGLQGGEIIYLQGNLGAGKTTLVRGLLNGLGYQGKVKSPTYMLVEHYFLKNKDIYHFDLYRLKDPEELEELGIRDYCGSRSICLFEWPGRGKGMIPVADILVSISYSGERRIVKIIADSSLGKSVVSSL